jgi:Arabinose-binding domain of AraC transcription regulator, N-term
MEAGTVAFEDIHAAAARLAARRLGHAQKRAADREARRLSRTIRARRAEVKAQLQRIAFIDEAAKLVGDDCFGFHLAMETDTRELGIIHDILSASDNALDATRNLIRYHHLVNTTTSLVIEESDQQVAIDTTFRPGLEGHDEPGVCFLDGPRRREAAARSHLPTRMVANCQIAKNIRRKRTASHPSEMDESRPCSWLRRRLGSGSARLGAVEHASPSTGSSASARRVWTEARFARFPVNSQPIREWKPLSER